MNPDKNENFEILLKKIKYDFNILPPQNEIAYTLLIKNLSDKEIQFNQLNIEVIISGTKTPLNADNIVVRAKNELSINMNRKLDPIEGLFALLKINDNYKIIGDVIIDNERKEIKIMGETK